MLIACWSAKGGVGTTVTAVGLALAAAHPSSSCLLVDLAGDVPLALGIAEPPGPGLAEWLAAGPDAPPDSLARLQVDVGGGLSVLPRGSGRLVEGRGPLLVQLLGSLAASVVVDCGLLGADGVAHQVAAQADRSLLVSRSCVLGLRRAVQAPLCPSGVIVLHEPGRGVGAGAVAHAVGAPVVAEVAIDPSVARLVDAGILRGRLPRSFSGVLAAVAGEAA